MQSLSHVFVTELRFPTAVETTFDIQLLPNE
jgi:hypothetical protein